MNTKLISLVVVILIVVSGVFVFRKGEVKKESVNVPAAAGATKVAPIVAD
jgi:uncharacterized protein YxeA